MIVDQLPGEDVVAWTQRRNEAILNRTPEEIAEGNAKYLAAQAQKAAAAGDPAWGEQAELIGVPRRYYAATLRDDIKPQDFPADVDWTTAQATLERVRTYVASDLPRGRALTLCGTPGTGKTHAAVGALRAVFRSTGCTGRMFWKVSLLRTVLIGDLLHRGAIIDGLMKAPMLVLDDVGVEFSRGEGDYFESIVDTVIDVRESDMLPLILTSNLDPAKLEKKLGPRAWDRLTGSWGAVYRSVGPSVRRKAGS